MLKRFLPFIGFMMIWMGKVSAEKDISQYVIDADNKKKIIIQLAEKYQQHTHMEFEAIKTDLIESMEKRRDKLNDEQWIKLEQQVEDYKNKEAILKAEKEFFEKAVTADNYMFMFCGFCLEEGDNQYGRFFLIPFAFVLDLASLPFEFVASAVTGF